MIQDSLTSARTPDWDILTADDVEALYQRAPVDSVALWVVNGAARLPGTEHDSLSLLVWHCRWRNRIWEHDPFALSIAQKTLNQTFFLLTTLGAACKHRR